MEIFEMLLDHGSLGLFAAFLVWLYTSMQKRMDALVDRFQDQLDRIGETQKQEILEIRNRYDEVISNYNNEISKTRLDVADKVKSILDWTVITEGKIQSIVVKLELLSDNNDEVKVIVTHILDAIKSIQQEQKIKDLASMARSRKDP